MIRPQAHRLALLALVATASILSGCGGGVSDKDQIAAIVKDEGTNPATLCNHLTNALLVRFGSRSACLRVAASSAKDPSAHATGVTVHGTNATAVVADRNGSRMVTFVRQKGVWKVAGVQ
jgi:H+/gluconate symporter-like permease